MSLSHLERFIHGDQQASCGGAIAGNLLSGLRTTGERNFCPRDVTLSNAPSRCTEKEGSFYVFSLFRSIIEPAAKNESDKGKTLRRGVLATRRCNSRAQNSQPVIKLRLSRSNLGMNGSRTI